MKVKRINRAGVIRHLRGSEATVLLDNCGRGSYKLTELKLSKTKKTL